MERAMYLWQVASGEPGRDYRRLFFDHDLMLLGPSHLGEARTGAYAGSIPNSAGSQVHNFATQPQPGDRVLLRLGKTVIGIGRIPDGSEDQYTFDETFRCVYGWDLCHRRRVTWAEGVDLNVFRGIYDKAKQKPSFTRVHETHIVEMVRSIPDAAFSRPLKPLPEIDHRVYTEDNLGVALFTAGISNRNIEDILGALRQADRLCQWYRASGSGRYPTEHEVVSHIVLPLFLGLGWSHQQIAVEWNRVDMAFFKRTPTDISNCVMVLEAKGLGQGLGEVSAQPQAYAARLALPNVQYIATTDGENLFLYQRHGDSWAENPVGYLNVTCLQHEYILPEGANPVDTLVKLQPSAI
ncbi:MAG TPA: hypothetical protein VFJ82_11380 [Longimicrobium sp.]|nr:hypothetical protein [Longimicrobium sp.]